MTSLNENARLLSTAELAEYLGIPVKTVYAWRYRRDGPPAFRIGRHLRFRLSDVDTWLLQHRDGWASV